MRQMHVGSDFDDFLKQDGLLTQCEAEALKRISGWQIEQEMKRRKISRCVSDVVSYETNYPNR